ncbi:hypothetical protein Tco_0478064 [Tanacetum coccineum]
MDLRVYTHPPEEGIKRRKAPTADVQTVNVSKNVRRRLPIGNHDTVDRNSLPVSRVFDCFRNMPRNIVKPDYGTHTDIRHPVVSRPLLTTLKREALVVDVETVGISINVRKRLPIRNHGTVDRTSSIVFLKILLNEIAMEIIAGLSNTPMCKRLSILKMMGSAIEDEDAPPPTQGYNPYPDHVPAYPSEQPPATYANRALHPKWRTKVMAIKDSKDLTSLSLDELIGNLKAKKESSDEECSTSGSEDEEYAMTRKRLKKSFEKEEGRIRMSKNPPKDKNQRAFVGGSWSDSGEEDDEKVKDETCLVAHASSEPDKWIKNSGCSKHMTGNRKLFSTYKTYNGGNVIFGSNLRGNIISKGYSQNSKAYIILNKHTRKVKESLNVTFDKTHPSSNTSPLVDNDLDEEEAIKVTEKKNLKNDIVDKTLEIDEIVNIKESRNHPLENVIGNLNQRTLRSQAQNQSNFFCFISTIEPKNVNEALGDESFGDVRVGMYTMQRINPIRVLTTLGVSSSPRNMTIKVTKWVFSRNDKFRRERYCFSK